MNSRGELIAAARPFTPDHLDVIAEISSEGVELTGSPGEISAYPERGPARQFEAIVTGLQDYLNRSGVTRKVLLGLSGGIDSALVAVLAAEAEGPENATTLSMPTRLSAEGSVTHYRLHAVNLEITLLKIAIQQIFESALEKLGPQREGASFGVAEDNLQSRIRVILLMSYANKFGGI